MRTPPRALTIVALVALAVATAYAQQRDTRVSQAGTGEISGVLQSADARPQPIRRAVVTIAGGDLATPRSVVTDDGGRFAFGRLPAGSYLVSAKKAAYLNAEFGSQKPGRAGSRVAIAAGEKRSIVVTMFKGAALGGTVRDARGNPLVGVSVTAIDVRTVGGPAPEPAPVTTSTDNRGMYRMYGLMPGEYVVAAQPAVSGSGETGARSAAEMDALLASLTQRQGRGAPPPGAASTPLPLSRPIGFAPIYFPGTPLFSDASRVRVAAGEDREAINFEARHVPVAAIRGTVSGNVANLAAVQLSITPDGPRSMFFPGGAGITAQPPNAKGEFSYGNLAPGRYRIVARARGGPVDTPAPAGTSGAGGLRGGPPPPGVMLEAAGDTLYAAVDIDVRGQDVDGVDLTLQLGGVLAGRVVFDSGGSPEPDDLTAVRVSVAIVGGSFVSQSGNLRIGTAISAIPPVSLRPDGTFLITGIGPAQYSVICQMPPDLSATWKARSAIVDGRDLLDTNLEGPSVNLRGVTIVVSDKRTELSGTLHSASGQVANEYYVIAFSTDRANWRPGARRTLSARPATDGRFVIADLPAGEYFVAALTDLDPAEWQRESFLEQVAPAAIRVRIGEGEKKVQNLQIK